MSGTAANGIHADVKEYYGKVLKTQNDLQTNACTMPDKRMPKYIRDALAMISDEVTSKYYGCGLVAPEQLEGMHILDLGSGSGQDCFVLAKLTGEKGQVTGIDMTEEQLEVARRNIPYHMDKFGYSADNVKFVHGYLERLSEAGLQDNSFDILVSNCVINLCPDKKAVLSEAHRVLKAGGEMYFSDVYADRELSEDVRNHKVLWGECISGAMDWRQLVKLCAEVGFAQPRLVSSKNMEVDKEELKAILGEAKFVSAVYRLFKLPEKTEQRTNVIYEGGILGSEEKLVLDHIYTFPKGDPVCVDGEVVTILKSSRFADDFTFEPPPKCMMVPILPQNEEDMDPFRQAVTAPKGGGCCAPKAGACC